MSIFGQNNKPDHVVFEQELQGASELREAYIYDELSRLPDDKRKEFWESEQCQSMLEAGLIGRKTLVRLSKSDDMERRITMAAMQLAKDHNDPLWDKLAVNRVRERDLLSKITTKYGAKAQRVAKMGQKEYLKHNKILGGNYTR